MNHSADISRCTGVAPSFYSNTDFNNATAVITSILVAISAAFSSLANSMVIVVLVRKRMLNSPLNLLLANMCLIDFIIGTIEHPFFVAIRIAELHFISLCSLRQVSSFLGYIFGGMTISTLCWISLDRWVAITMPFKYESIVTRKRCVILLVISFIFCTGMVLLGKFGILATNFYYLIVSFLLIVLTAQTLFCYAKIYKIARGHERKIDITRRVTERMTVSNENENQSYSLESGASARRERLSADSKRRKSKTVLYMAVLMIICYLPKGLIILDAFLIRKTSELPYAALKWSETLFLLNSTFNPIVYCLRMACIRAEIWKMLGTLSSMFRRG